MDLDASFLPRHLSERNRPRFYQYVPLFILSCKSHAHEAVRCSSGGWGWVLYCAGKFKKVKGDAEMAQVIAALEAEHAECNRFR